MVSRVISSKNTLPILDNFLFKLEGNELEITASDLESTLTTKITLDNVLGDGSIAIPFKILIDTLKEFSEQPLLSKLTQVPLQLLFTGEWPVQHCWPTRR